MSEKQFKFNKEHKGMKYFLDEAGLPSFGKIEKKKRILSLLEYNKCFLVMKEDFHNLNVEEVTEVEDCIFYQDFKGYAWKKEYFDFIKEDNRITKYYLGKENWVMIATSKEQDFGYMVAPVKIEWSGYDDDPKKHACMCCNNIIFEGKITWVVSEFKSTKRPYCNSICMKNDEGLGDF